MNKRELLQRAKEYKRDFETIKTVDNPYFNNDTLYWCVNFYLYGKNSGFLIISDKESTYEDQKSAFWHISNTTALINGISVEMADHTREPLLYFKTLQKLLKKWKLKYIRDAVQFTEEINVYNEMVNFYKDTQKEIKQLRKKLLAKSYEIIKKQKIEQEDTEDVMRISSNYNYLVYMQLLKQMESINCIRLINNSLRDKKNWSWFLRQLRKYADYYVTAESVERLQTSIDDFKGYGTDLLSFKRSEGEEKIYQLFLQEHIDMFENECKQWLRNTKQLVLT